MMRPLETTYRGRPIVLECTHKKQFPPPQMYGTSPEGIDILWRQGSINATQYQFLKTWQERCRLMVMGPRCLDCPLALKQNPRPGRPHVIETESWLEAKKRMYWEDMKSGKMAAGEEPEPQVVEPVDPSDIEEPELEEPELEEPEGDDDELDLSSPAPSATVASFAETTVIVEDPPRPGTPESDEPSKEEPSKNEGFTEDDIISALATDE